MMALRIPARRPRVDPLRAFRRVDQLLDEFLLVDWCSPSRDDETRLRRRGRAAGSRESGGTAAASSGGGRNDDGLLRRADEQVMEMAEAISRDFWRRVREARAGSDYSRGRRAREQEMSRLAEITSRRPERAAAAPLRLRPHLLPPRRFTDKRTS
ncbi:uncharacterized protein A4U43_C08F2620 [Asparagus officinalis]|nr:uncharacterized protein A4U43_C08F2620 [Asparagus officinalis]